jgi:hypothetical protein
LKMYIEILFLISIACYVGKFNREAGKRGYITIFNSHLHADEYPHLLLLYFYGGIK